MNSTAQKTGSFKSVQQTVTNPSGWRPAMPGSVQIDADDMQIHGPYVRSCRTRKGIAATELAVCLPILLVLIVGTIEACSMVYLKQSLSVAAYEGVRVSVSPNGDPVDVTTAANRILTARNVKSATVTVSPADFATLPAETWVSVRVAAPVNANSIISGFFYDAIVVDGEATMMKEF